MSAHSVWLATIGEPLPTDERPRRLLRAGLLARTLARRGDNVIWWTSTFDHSEKRQRANADTARDCDGYRIELLYGPSYRRNVSLARAAHHRAIGRRFAEVAETRARPDVIVASLPIPELADAAVQYGRRHGIPVIVDVRDLWPDVILEMVPAVVRPLARVVAAPIAAATDRALRGATALIGPSEGFVDWGLTRAGRTRTSCDRAVPFGYVATPPSDEERARARAAWRERGVERSNDDLLTACFFGTIGYQFSLKTVIDAARRCFEERRPWRFVVCGAGATLPALRRYAAGLPNVVLPGSVGQAEIWELMRLSAVGIAPYRPSPNFALNIPNKFAEYLSAALPVLTTIDGEVGSRIRATGCGALYRHDSPAALVDALRAFEGRDEREHASAAARALFEREFVAERLYERLADFLWQVAAESKPRVHPCVT